MGNANDSKFAKVLIASLTRTVAVIVTLAIGVGIFSFLFITKPKPPEPRDDTSLPTVRVIQTATVPVQRQWVGFGTARAMTAVDVPARVTGVVETIESIAKEGNVVEVRETIINLQQLDFQQNLDVIDKQLAEFDSQLEQLDVELTGLDRRLKLAETDTAVVQRDLNRLQKLYDQNDARELELDQAISRVNAAKLNEAQLQDQIDQIAPRHLRIEAQRQSLAAQKKIATTNLERTTIASPISGVIEMVDVEVGEQVTPGQRVARIVNLEIMEVPVRLPASARVYAQIGDDVSLSPTGGGDLTWDGKITRIAPEDDESTRTFAVYVEVQQDPADSGLLTPGRYVAATVKGQSMENRVVVPRQSVRDDAVFVIESNILKRRPVSVSYYFFSDLPALDLPTENYWAVLDRSGMDEPIGVDELVVLDAGIDLPPGTEVEVNVLNQPKSADAKPLVMP